MWELYKKARVFRQKKNYNSTKRPLLSQGSPCVLHYARSPIAKATFICTFRYSSDGWTSRVEWYGVKHHSEINRSTGCSHEIYWTRQGPSISLFDRKGDGTKCKPFNAFAGAKRESKSLHEEFKRRCSVASSANGWMNEELTLRWCDEVLGNFSFRKRLLAWDSYEAHKTDKVKRKLVNTKVESVIVPGGCTKYMQAPNLVWNKLFKARIQEFYDSKCKAPIYPCR